MSLSEGNAKTCLEQIPVTYSRKAYGSHKSTFTTPRKSVKSVLSVKSVVEIKTASAPVPGGHYQIVTGGNALGYSPMISLCLEGSTPQD